MRTRRRLSRRYLGRIGQYEIEAVRHTKKYRKRHRRRSEALFGKYDERI